MLKYVLIIAMLTTSIYCQNCYTSCGGCTSLGTSTNHMCSSCKASYYPLSDASNMCFQTTDTTRPTNYFFNVDIFTKCYASCATCIQVGYSVAHNCGSCATTYYPLSDNRSMCYVQGDTSVPASYIFQTNQFTRCYISCGSCSQIGTVPTAQYCSTCASSYYQLADDSTRCFAINDTNLPSNYVYSSATSKFQKCYTSCGSCSAVGTSTAHNCLTCASTFYKLSDNSSMCYAQGDATVPTYYVFLTNIYQRCYVACATCTAGGNPTTMSCSTCAATYFPLSDDSTRCYQNVTNSGAPANYVFVSANNKYMRCYLSCSTCTGAGNSTNMYCGGCASGFYPLSDNISQCYANQLGSGLPSNYIFVSAQNQFVKCYASCTSCSAPGTSTAHNCATCSSPYYQLSDQTSMCYQQGDVAIPAYYIFITNIFQRCYVACGTCSAAGTSSAMNCSTCATGYYALSDDPTRCYQNIANSGAPANYVFILAQNKYVKCYASCATCSGAGTPTAMSCSTCASTYFPLSDSTSMCYQSGDVNVPTYYIFQTTQFTRCYVSCNKCTAVPGTAQAHACLTGNCFTGYYPLSNDGTLCYQNIANSGAPANYVYVSGSSNFQPCYVACATCASVGTISAMACSTCNNAGGYYALSDNISMCYQQSDVTRPPNYIFVAASNQFVKCYTACGTCSAAGTVTTMNCSTCLTGATNYYPLPDKPTQCYQSTGDVNLPANYLWNGSTAFIKCYAGCATCSAGYVNATTQNCLTCNTASNYYQITTDNTNCYQAGDTNIPSGSIYDCVSKWIIGSCYLSCNTCSCTGTSNTMNCTACKTTSSYFPLSDTTSQCWQDADGTRPQNYALINNVFQKCYASCATCSNTAVGTASAMNCATCAANYYKLSDNPAMCYNSTDAARPQNYVLDAPNTQWAKCYTSCATCTLGSNSTTHKCTVGGCATGYYPLPDQTTQCFLPTGAPSNYLFVNNAFVKCYVGCSSCSAAPSGTIQSCTACDTTNLYYPLVDDSTYCYKTGDTIPSNYTFSAATSKWVHCYVACATCSAPGTVAAMNCSSCSNQYFPLSNDTTKCYQRGDVNLPTGYTFDCTVNKFVQATCYSSCNTCSCTGTQATMNCVTCATGLYPLQDANTQCWANSDTARPQSYVLVSTTFMKCYTSCGSCSAVGTQSSHLCNTCAAGYYPLSDQTSQCFQQTDSTRPAYYVFNVNRFDRCYAGCATCTVGSNSQTHNCSACATSYFPLSDKTTQCYTQNDTTRPANYIFQLNVHNRCYDSCGTCSNTGNVSTQNCLTCANLFYKLYNDATRCYANPDTNLPSNYYFNGTNNQFEACYSSCATCSAAGTATTQNCLTCIANYFPLSNDSTKCYKLNDPNLPAGYTYDCNGHFAQGGCYTACATCNCTGIYSKMNCLTCASTYFPLVDNKAQCYLNADVNRPQNYVLISTQFAKCFASCASCSTTGTVDVMNCTTCITGYYPLEDKTSLCYTPSDSNRPANYFYNLTKFSLCYTSCLTCAQAGTSTTHNCTKCAVGYYRLSDNVSQCYTQTAPDVPPNYIFNPATGWDRCYAGCATCTQSGNVVTQYCKTCSPIYYPLEDDLTRCFKYDNSVSPIVIDASLPTGYRFNNSIWQKCYTSCGTCSAAGNATTHNCTICKTNYYPLATDTTMCFQINDSLLPPGLVFDCINNKFIAGSCYSSCKTCTCNGTTTNHYCATCADTYYPLSDQRNMCYKTDDTSKPANYIFQFTIFNKCDTSCATCYNISTASGKNCSTCANNYYPLEDVTSNCYLQNDSSRPLNYYFNTNKFSKCYQSCGSCTQVGDKNAHNCATCATNYYPLDSDRSKCYFVNGDPLLPPSYGLDVSSFTFKPLIGSCYNRCATCASPGTAANHYCVTCLPGNYAVEGQPGMCYNSTDTVAIAQYYFFSNMYRKCYVGCNGCTFGYFLATQEHNCIACASGYYPMAGSPSKCFQTLPGYYLSSNTWNACPAGCSACSNATTCSGCKDGFYFGNSKCYQTCPDGTYTNFANWTCVNCDPSCKTCTNGSSCSLCNDKFYSIGSGQLCGACFYNCASCSKAGQCLSCVAGWYLLGNTCTNSCPIGYYPDPVYNVCKSCISPCNTCSSLTQCIDCAPGYTFDTTAGKCVRTTCTANQYYDLTTNKCINCVAPCATCINATLCNSCTTGLIYSAGKCLATCPSATFFRTTDSTCQPCSKMCASCTNATDFCTLCASGTFGYIQPQGVENVTRQCVPACPTGMYPEAVTNLCKTCSDLKWVMYQGNCVSACPTGFTVNSTNNTCTSSTTTTVSSCTPNPCQNNTTCVAITGGFTCTCGSTFYGTLCQNAYKQGIYYY
jgi:hypothetical protein